MKKSVRTQTSTPPQAFITQRKQRVKQHKSNQVLLDSIVYLNDGDEYEIELFNTKSVHVLAKIKIQGEYISGGGIVLRPGERVFLERFIDSNNKFVFRTYNVDNEAVQLGATRDNGWVEIDFYTEQIQAPNYISNNSTIYLPLSGGTVTIDRTGSNTIYTTGVSLTSGITNTTYLSNATLSTNTFAGPNIRTANIETGRTEKGSASNQQFTQTYKNFNMGYCEAIAYKILPNSQKQYHKEDLGVLYCGECGAKRKKDSHKFCPHCGTKF